MLLFQDDDPFFFHVEEMHAFKAAVSFFLRLIGSAMFGVTFNLVTSVELQ